MRLFTTVAPRLWAARIPGGIHNIQKFTGKYMD